MTTVHRRAFLTLTAAALASPKIFADTKAPWRDALIINALVAEDPNPHGDKEGSQQRDD